MEIKKILVVGAGYMGNGIAQVAALAGYQVWMQDLDEERLQRGLEEIKWSLGKFLSKGKISHSQYQSTLANLNTITRIDDAQDADLVIESIPEDLHLKSEVFARLEEICSPRAILGTNTSAIPISSIAAAISTPERVCGIHFFGPVPLMRPCEVIRGLLTSQHTMEMAADWVRSLGKEAVLVNRDIAGFIANRVNIPISLEVVRLLEAGQGSAEQLDLAGTFGAPVVGPLQIMDNAGIDTATKASLAIFWDTRDPKFFPPPLMRRMVAAGMLGRKSGRGFYDYSVGEKVDYFKPIDDFQCEPLSYRIYIPSVFEAVRLVEAGIATPADIDKISRLGFNFPLGPLELMDLMGLDTFMDKALEIYRDTGDSRFLPPPMMRRMVAAGMLGRKSGRGFYDYQIEKGA